MTENSHFIKIRSRQCQALSSQSLTIEVLRSRGINQLMLTGLPDAWLRDSRDKIRALVSRLVDWGPLHRVLIHLLPADESKSGAHLELPIVIGCLAVLAKSLPPGALDILNRYTFVGSLNLEGKIEATSITKVLERADPDLTIGPSRFSDLAQLWNFLMSGKCAAELPSPPALRPERLALNESSEIPEVRGLLWHRFWLVASAIANQPALLIGPPGSGKSHLAKWSSKIIPSPEGPRDFEVRQLWSLAGQSRPQGAPVLAPHSRTILAEFLGKNVHGIPRPGLFSLAHGGTLILDEFSEMNRDCREILRTILDRRIIQRQSSWHFIDWPADFWLIATSNPCPCGYSRGEDGSRCQCPESIRRLYWGRFSGPLLDRFGLKLFVPSNVFARENEETQLRKWFDIDLLDGPAAPIQNLVRAGRTRFPEHFKECIAIVQNDPVLARLSERDKRNKAALLAAMQSITRASSTDLLFAIFWLRSLEEGVFGSQPPRPQVLIRSTV